MSLLLLLDEEEVVLGFIERHDPLGLEFSINRGLDFELPINRKVDSALNINRTADFELEI